MERIEPGGLHKSMGPKESDTTEQLITHVSKHKIGIIVYSSGVIARIGKSKTVIHIHHSMIEASEC